MMDITNKDCTSMTDSALMNVIGSYIRYQRLEQNKTQAQTAHDAGINRSTLVQIENGESITLSSLISILRALDLLHLINNFIIDERISPIEYAKLQEKRRKRASSNQTAAGWNKDLEW